MDGYWAATMFANFVLAAMLIACRPKCMGWTTGYVVLSIIADWFCLGNLQHLHDELYNVPWEFLDLASIAMESLMLVQMALCMAPGIMRDAAGLAVALHLSLRFHEYQIWDTFTGARRFDAALNRENWQAFYLRQDAKLLMTIALVALILKSRTERTGETHDTP